MWLRSSCLVFVLLALAGASASAQIPSARIRMGLNGQVRAIRLEVQEYSWKDPRWERSGDLLHDVIRYDRKGRCITSHIDPGTGWRPYGIPNPPAIATKSQRYEIISNRGLKWKTVWQFDKEGRLERFEAYALYDHGPSLSNWEHYHYDSEGRVGERTFWFNWGRSPNQTEPYPPVRVKYWFDSVGRIGGWTDDHDSKTRVTLTYDAKGHLIKHLDERVDGNITYVNTYEFEGYDRQGNWTVQTITKHWRTDDGDDPMGKTVLRRAITYRRA